MTFIGRRIRVFQYSFGDRHNEHPKRIYEGIIFWEDFDSSFDWQVHICFTIDKAWFDGEMKEPLPKHSWVYNSPYQMSIDLRDTSNKHSIFVDNVISIPLPPTDYGLSTPFIIDNMIKGKKGFHIYKDK